MIKLLTAVALIALALPAYAQIIIGGEFEFVDPRVEVIPGSGLKGHEKDMATRMVDAVRRVCPPPQCMETKVAGKFGVESQFQLANGFWFQVSWDPNVVEIITKPESRATLFQMAPALQNLIWETAASVGLRPDPQYRAGNFNFSGIQSFNGSSSEFLKFFVDFANRPELSNGILRQTNLMNSPHLASLSQTQRVALTDLVREFQEAPAPVEKTESLWRRINPFARAKNLSEMSISELSKILLKRVLYEGARPDHIGETAWHYQALGLKKLVGLKAQEDAPVEMRAVRSQRDIYDFLLLAELVEARIKYLNKLPSEKAFLVSETSRTQFSHAELVDRFYIYVQEAGLSWDRYQRLLPPHLAALSPNDLLMQHNFSAKHFQNAKDLGVLMDLVATSPWLENKMAAVFESPHLTQEVRTHLLTEMERVVFFDEGSKALKRQTENIKIRFDNTQILVRGGQCSSVFN